MGRKIMWTGWRLILPLLFVFFFIHLLKDITQDILKISTPLDLLGDAKEDLSFLPKSIRNAYLYGLGGLSILAEVFLLITIPKVWRRSEFTRLELWVVATIIGLILFFLSSMLLDPSVYHLNLTLL